MEMLCASARCPQHSLALRSCLALCLRIGNTLNRGTARGNAGGFDLTVLPTLAAVKSAEDKSLSLMHVIAQESAPIGSVAAGGNERATARVLSHVRSER